MFVKLRAAAQIFLGGITMAKHIQVVFKGKLQENAKNGGCGNCQSSCQSACKTSCTVGNQACEK